MLRLLLSIRTGAPLCNPLKYRGRGLDETFPISENVPLARAHFLVYIVPDFLLRLVGQ